MRNIKLFFWGCVISIVSGCANLSGTQPPAPVYGAQSGKVTRAEKQPETKVPSRVESDSSSTVKIQPIKDITTPEVIPLEPTITETPIDFVPAPSSSTDALPVDVSPPSTDTQVTSAAQVAPIAQTENIASAESGTFQPLESVASGSAAVSALVLAANQDSKSGKMDSAVATMERAIRLEPRNPTLLYKLAVLRLQQSKPAQAEDLAKKAALLASKDAKLKKHSWLLIARARELQNDEAGAKEARLKADSM